MDDAAPSIICQVAAANGCSSLRYHCTVTSTHVSLHHGTWSHEGLTREEAGTKGRFEETEQESDSPYGRDRERKR